MKYRKLKYIVLVFLLYNIFCDQTFGIERPDFLTAVAKNIITPTIQGSRDNYESHGDIIEVSIQNNTNKTIETTLERGTILKSNNPDTQDLVVTKDLTMRVGPHEFLDPPVYAFCIQVHKDAPSTADFFTPSKKKATGRLMRLVNYINKNNLHYSSVAQTAIWIITDKITPMDMYDYGEYIQAKSILKESKKENGGDIYSDVLPLLLLIIFPFALIFIITILNKRFI